MSTTLADEMQVFRNALGEVESGVRNAQQELPALVACLEDLENTKGAEAEDQLAEARLRLGHRALDLKAALLKGETLLKKLQQAVGEAAMRNASQPARFVEADGRDVRRVGQPEP